MLEAGFRKGRFQKLRALFPGLVCASALGVGIGAHFGGILVYGHDYYSSAISSSTGSPGPSRGAGSPALAGGPRFETEILPLFERHCFRCHGPGKQKGRLRLDSRDAVLRGGKSGPAVLPGDGSQSLLYRAITDPDPDTRMPQEAPPLRGADIERIRAWIDQGAP
jgi:hypothetical protein